MQVTPSPEYELKYLTHVQNMIYIQYLCQTKYLSECPKVGGVFLHNHKMIIMVNKNDSLMFDNQYSYFPTSSTFAETMEDIILTLRATHCMPLFCFKNSRLWSSPMLLSFEETRRSLVLQTYRLSHIQICLLVVPLMVPLQVSLMVGIICLLPS